jgi:hypothetical protein
MTTYYLSIFLSTAAISRKVVKVEVFDLALVDYDGVGDPLLYAQPVQHSVVANMTSPSLAAFILELRLPAFSRSVEYDPSLGLGTLAGSKAEGGGSSFLVVAVAVAVPVAVAAVFAVIVGIVAVAWWRNRRRVNTLSAVNFDGRESEQDVGKL